MSKPIMPPTPLERQMAEQIAAMEDELNRDVRREQLAIMKKAAADMAKLRGMTGSDGLVPSLFAVQVPGVGKRLRSAASVHQAAEFALEDAAHPLPLADLFPKLASYGRTPTGKKPSWNLSNVLSTHRDTFESVFWRGNKCWWLAGKPVPPE